jgi:predicted transcriptional regulator
MLDWNSPGSLADNITKCGLTVSAFAERAGVSKAQLYRLIAGEFKPSFRTQQKIEGALASCRRKAA